MKGIELPINILIIIAIAVIVLIALISMFYPAFSSGSTTVNSESAKSAACQVLVETKRCNGNTAQIAVYNFDANKDGSMVSGTEVGWPGADGTVRDCTTPGGNDNLMRLCLCYYGIIDTSNVEYERKCKALCGC